MAKVKEITYHKLMKKPPEDIKICCIGTGSLFGFFIYSIISRGYSDFILIDDDTYELKNLLKNPWLHPVDINKYKVDFWVDRVKMLNENIKIKSVKKRLTSKDIDLIEESDIIFCSVDNNESRLYIQQICINKAKPLVDAGSGIYADADGNIIESGMRIRVYIPDSPCLFCQGVRIMPFEKQKQRQSGNYVIGNPFIRDTSVNLNQIAGSISAVILDNLCKGKSVPVEIRFDELNLKLFNITHFKLKDCILCGNGKSR